MYNNSSTYAVLIWLTFLRAYLQKIKTSYVYMICMYDMYDIAVWTRIPWKFHRAVYYVVRVFHVLMQDVVMYIYMHILQYLYEENEI